MKTKETIEKSMSQSINCEVKVINADYIAVYSTDKQTKDVVESNGIFTFVKEKDGNRMIFKFNTELEN